LGVIAGIVITNKNHTRAADRFAGRFQVPIYERGFTAEGLVAITIDGAPPGEVALYCEADEGTLIVGDALINFEPYGFALLPEKYCSNLKTMCDSLSNLLDYSFERLLFAHGTPILSGARQRLEQLLLAR
jgi:glyoxylase-like metal-dependent hydrolase (beta-lactamase superfamily II)